MTDDLEKPFADLMFGADIAERLRCYIAEPIAKAAADEIERLRAALEQAVDDFGTGHSVCEQTKQMCIAALGNEQTPQAKS